MNIQKKKSFIYKIKNNVSNLVYIGSTHKNLKKRLYGHKTDYNRYLENKRGFISSFILFENDGYKDCIIELLEEIIDKDNDFIKNRESYYINSIECVNINNPKKKTKEEIKEYDRNRQKTPEAKARRKIMIKCDCGADILKVGKARHLKSTKHKQVII